MRSLLSVACASSNLQPNQSFRNQAVACLKCYQSNKSLFCVCSCPLTKTFSCISFNYHLPSLLLSSSPAFPLPFLPLFILPIYSSLLCCPTWPLITPPIGCAPLALRWLCPLPECHLCPRSASASPLHPPRGPLRSRSIDRQKSGMATSVSADGALDPSLVRIPVDVQLHHKHHCPTKKSDIYK